MDDLQPVAAPSTPDPLITVAIPTCNRVGWLKDCIVSALAQSYQHFEVLVSDNASTDETPIYLETIFDLRLRVIRQKSNIGLLPNWNAMLGCSQGRLYCFCFRRRPHCTLFFGAMRCAYQNRARSPYRNGSEQHIYCSER